MSSRQPENDRPQPEKINEESGRRICLDICPSEFLIEKRSPALILPVRLPGALYPAGMDGVFGQA